MSAERVAERRAIEALRAGVPSRDAVRALGSAQPRIEERFRAQLDGAMDAIENRTQVPGLLVAGDFGAGKSHLLEHLEHVALEQKFVCSTVVISKETPLYDAAKLYRAAVLAAVVPDRRGHALAEICANVPSSSRDYERFREWAHDPQSGLDARFAATLFLYERAKDEEIKDRIVSFWSGDPLNNFELRRWLREYGEATTYRLDKVSTKELSLHRFAFAPRLMVAAGYSGWVLLVDEVELIGRYSFKQRARSYAELARWAGKLEGERFPGLTTVFAITLDFTAEVLQARNDSERIPGRLRASSLEADLHLASRAERGMRIIERETVPLHPPDREMVERTREQVRQIHGRAYNWDPPPLTDGQQLTTARMRHYVRRWINEWDLKRLYPDDAVETIVHDISTSYSEDPELEADGQPP